MVLNPKSNGNEGFPIMLTEISVWDQYNDIIKPSRNGGLESVVDSVIHKILISNTKLMSFIRTKSRKRTPKLRQICGFELYIITKDMHIDLNISIKNIVTDLQQKSVEIHTHNS